MKDAARDEINTGGVVSGHQKRRAQWLAKIDSRQGALASRGLIWS